MTNPPAVALEVIIFGVAARRSCPLSIDAAAARRRLRVWAGL
ncbi:hypothetical protein [Frankia sp. AiPa1]|nr:hypothetical protein [Frankia sp. AiPa1]